MSSVRQLCVGIVPSCYLPSRVCSSGVVEVPSHVCCHVCRVVLGPLHKTTSMVSWFWNVIDAGFHSLARALVALLSHCLTQGLLLKGCSEVFRSVLLKAFSVSFPSSPLLLGVLSWETVLKYSGSMFLCQINWRPLHCSRVLRSTLRCVCVCVCVTTCMSECECDWIVKHTGLLDILVPYLVISLTPPVTVHIQPIVKQKLCSWAHGSLLLMVFKDSWVHTNVNQAWETVTLIYRLPCTVCNCA